MKKNTFYSLIMMLSIFLVSQAIPFGQLKAEDPPVKRELARMTTQLSLTDAQVAEVERILLMLHSQAEKDRENYKGNLKAVIGAAKQRQVMESQLIMGLLNPDQQAIYSRENKDKKKKLEFITWKEGLGLNDYQCMKLTTILDENYNRVAVLKDRTTDDSNLPESMRRDAIPNQARHDLRRTGSSMGKESAWSRGKRTIDKVKYKKIKEFLTPEQKNKYKEVRSFLEKELEEM